MVVGSPSPIAANTFVSSDSSFAVVVSSQLELREVLNPPINNLAPPICCVEA